jgi:glyoxylase-like metal-dependent hydrolase (beta-lactamase superfamily II)
MKPDSKELIRPCQSYVVRTSHHNILIDTCVGNHKDMPQRPTWHQKTDDNYMQALKAHNLAPKDIDYVMCTHLHGDHVGWNTQKVNGEWVPTFPNAKYVLSQKEFDVTQAMGDKNPRVSAFNESVLPIVASGQAQLVSNDFALDDEVWLEPSPGHTPDHFSVRLASRDEDAVMCGDLMHSPVQCLHPEWVAMPDYDPALAQQTRRGFLERYADTASLVCTAHFPLPSVGRIVSKNGSFAFDYEASDW